MGQLHTPVVPSDQPAEHTVKLRCPVEVRRTVEALLLDEDRAWFEAHASRHYRLTEPMPGALRLVECYPRSRYRLDLYASPVAGDFNRFASLAVLSRADLSPEDATEDWLKALPVCLQ